MSLCTRNRWGPGTKSTNNTSNNSAIEEKLKKIKEEREKQNTMWATTSSSKETGK